MSETEKLKFIKLWRMFGFIGLFLILLASLAPQRGEAPSIENLDKALHFIVYAIASWYLHQTSQNRLPVKLSFSLFCYSALIEVLQYLTETRSAQWLDLAANLLGIASGLFFSRFVFSAFLRKTDRRLSKALEGI